MKKVSLLLAAASLIATATYAQTIRRVSNIPGAAIGANTYTNIPEAITAADNDDVIYIEPSSTTYPGFTVNKKLHFIGNGYFLTENSDTPQNKATSRISGLVEYVAGSGDGSARGIEFDAGIQLANSYGVLFRGNHIQNIQLGLNTGGHTIIENFIDAEVRGASDNSAGQTIALSNNIIFGSILYLKNSSITHNSISGANGYFSVYENSGCQISNNILDAETNAINPFPDLHALNNNSSISHNLKLIHPSVDFPDQNLDGSIYSHLGSETFVVESPWGHSPRQDKVFMLKAGSPAAGSGTGGADIGAFGSASPYRLSGMPRLPVITALTSSNSGSPLSPLQVTISVKSN